MGGVMRSGVRAGVAGVTVVRSVGVCGAWCVRCGVHLREDVAVALADHRDGFVVRELVDAVVEVAHPHAVELAAAEQVRRRR